MGTKAEAKRMRMKAEIKRIIPCRSGKSREQRKKETKENSEKETQEKRKEEGKEQITSKKKRLESQTSSDNRVDGEPEEEVNSSNQCDDSEDPWMEAGLRPRRTRRGVRPRSKGQKKGNKRTPLSNSNLGAKLYSHR